MGKTAEEKAADETLTQSEADLDDELEQAMQSLNLVQMKMRITKKDDGEEAKEGEEAEPTYCVELIGQDVDKFRFDRAAIDLTKTCLAFAIDDVEVPVE